jgi:hypothetical protein
MIHGGDYNPEQWLHDKSVWDKDMELMRGANINEMTVGIFSWAVLEPREGEFDFSFLDEIIDKIYAGGGRVVLATPSGARPHWLSDKYPEVNRVNKDLVRAHFRGRHNHCYTSPVYREKVRIINEKLAERYGKHPAVIAWHLSNEYGGECYCPDLAAVPCGFQPDYVLSAYGVNDWHQLTQPVFEDRCRRFWSSLCTNYPDAKKYALMPIWFIPTRETAFGPFEDLITTIYRVMADFPQVTLIRGWDLVPHDPAFFGDARLHPNDKGFDEYFRNLIREL